MAQYIQSTERKKLKTKNTLPGKFIIIEGEIQNFPDKQKLKEFVTTKLALQEILKGFL